MSRRIYQRVEEARVAREQHALRRSVGTFETLDGRRVRDAEGRVLINFASNDYLGLRTHQQLSRALAIAAEHMAVGAGASHLLGGHHPEHRALAAELAEWTGQERAMLFASGYCAALGTLPALLVRGERVLHDRLNHACLLDASVLARAEIKRYRHLDLVDAQRQVGEGRASMVVSDSVFSMDGDCAPLAGLVDLARQHDLLLLLDEAHALGVLGPEGGGMTLARGLQGPSVLILGTLGKALGTAGAFIAGPDALIRHLEEHARSFVYSTAPPPVLAAATRYALRLAKGGQSLREHLRELIAHFQHGLARLGLTSLRSETPIQPIMLGSARRAVRASDYLRDRGIYVPAIRPPTVPNHGARLRVSLSAAHSREDLDQLLAALERWRSLDDVRDENQ